MECPRDNNHPTLCPICATCDRDEARCGVCGGQIHQWHSALGRWYHDTVSADDHPFDIIDAWHKVKHGEWHEGEPMVIPMTSTDASG